MEEDRTRIPQDESLVVEISLIKFFQRKEIAAIYRRQLREWLEHNIPSYLWPDGFEIHTETLDSYDQRHAHKDWAEHQDPD